MMLSPKREGTESREMTNEVGLVNGNNTVVISEEQERSFESANTDNGAVQEIAPNTEGYV